MSDQDIWWRKFVRSMSWGEIVMLDLTCFFSLSFSCFHPPLLPSLSLSLYLWLSIFLLLHCCVYHCVIFLQIYVYQSHTHKRTQHILYTLIALILYTFYYAQQNPHTKAIAKYTRLTYSFHCIAIRWNSNRTQTLCIVRNSIWCNQVRLHTEDIASSKFLT